MSASNDLTFIRCASCRSLVPAVSSRCRMCGNSLRPEESECSDEERRSPRVRQPTTSLTGEETEWLRDESSALNTDYVEEEGQQAIEEQAIEVQAPEVPEMAEPNVDEASNESFVEVDSGAEEIEPASLDVSPIEVELADTSKKSDSTTAVLGEMEAVTIADVSEEMIAVDGSEASEEAFEIEETNSNLVLDLIEQPAIAVEEIVLDEEPEDESLFDEEPVSKIDVETEKDQDEVSCDESPAVEEIIIEDESLFDGSVEINEGADILSEIGEEVSVADPVEDIKEAIEEKIAEDVVEEEVVKENSQKEDEVGSVPRAGKPGFSLQKTPGRALNFGRTGPSPREQKADPSESSKQQKPELETVAPQRKEESARTNREHRANSDKSRQEVVDKEPAAPTTQVRSTTRIATPASTRLFGWLVSYSSQDGSAIELREGKTLVTRSSLKNGDLVIDAPSISTPHALLMMGADTGFFIQDLISERGVWIRRKDEDTYHQEENSIELFHGDWVRIGDVEFLVSLVPYVGVR
jgi:hypothetical protein